MNSAPDGDKGALLCTLSTSCDASSVDFSARNFSASESSDLDEQSPWAERGDEEPLADMRCKDEPAQ